MNVRLIQGDCIEKMKEMQAGSVHTCVTSPPYFGLRDYLCDGQIGLEKTPDEFVAKLVDVFREVRRVLREDGTLWLNLGDSFNSSPSNQNGKPRDGFNGGNTERWSGQGRQKRDVPGLKPKDLLGIPWRVAFALQADGAADPKAVRIIGRLRDAILASYEAWEDVPAPVRHELSRLDAEYAQAKAGSWYLRSDIIWHKPNPMPESVRDRPTKSHEYLFLLSKSATYHYDADAVREPHCEEVRRAIGKIGARDKAGKYNAPPGQGAHGNLSRGGNNNAYANPLGRNRRSVWSVATKSFRGAHFATFPPKLIEPCILAGTSEAGCCPACGKPWERVVERTSVREQMGAMLTGGKMESLVKSGDRRDGLSHSNSHDIPQCPIVKTLGFRPACECNAGDAIPCTVLDPFAGAFTTGVVAKEHGRSFVGIELNPEYLEMGRERLANTPSPLAGVFAPRAVGLAEADGVA